MNDFSSKIFLVKLLLHVSFGAVQWENPGIEQI